MKAYLVGVYVEGKPVRACVAWSEEAANRFAKTHRQELESKGFIATADKKEIDLLYPVLFLFLLMAVLCFI